MPRERNGAAAAREPLERGHQLLAEILDWKHDHAMVAALLGPPGAGKTAVLEKAVESARSRKFQVEYIDLLEARELWDVDEFYGWLVRKLREGWWNEIPVSPSPRLSFCTMLSQALKQRRQPVLLALDHLESVPESFAFQFASDLREIQNLAAGGGEWGRLRCVIAGAVSVFELRRQVNSPNLQFQLHVLPNFSASEAEEATRRHLRNTGRSADDEAIQFLVHYTGGEPAFLSALDSYLQMAQIEKSDAEAAVGLLLLSAGQYRHLSQVASLYLLDRAFQEKADRMLAGLPVALPAPATDIDRYQLAGAWIATGKLRTQPRFRNGLIQQVIQGVREQFGDSPVDQGLISVSRLQKFAIGSSEIPQLLECTESAWKLLSGVEGSAKLVLTSRNSAFAVNSVSISPVSLPEWRPVEGNGHQPHSVASRVDGEWVVDTHWPSPDQDIILRIQPDRSFTPNVTAREMLRLWSLFAQPLSKLSLQLALQALGRHTLRQGLAAGPKKIFVSSTYLDLVTHRRCVLEQVVRRDLLFRGMEFFGAEPASPPPAAKIVREVREADVYLGIFGIRYGSVDPKSGCSMTELEFNAAESSGKPMLLYVMRDDATVKASDFDGSTDAKRKALLDRVRKHTVYQFATVEDLGRQVYEDLGKL